MLIVWFGLAATAGAGIRFGLASASLLSFPVGALLANVVGSFVMGVAASGYFEKNWDLLPKVVLMTAFLGALTTFSSYALEVVQFMIDKKWAQLVLCIFSHNLLSISACYIGLKSFSP